MANRGEAKADITAERASQLAFDQLEFVLRSIKARLWVRPVIGLALALSFSRGNVPLKPAIWLALLIAAGIPSAWMARRFLTRPAFAARSAMQWQQLYSLSYVPFALAWTSQVYFLWRPADVINHCMIILTLGCSVSIIIPLLGACLPLARTAFAIIGSGFLGAALLSGTSSPYIFSLVVIVYLALLYSILRQVHAAATKTLLLRYENNDLLTEQRKLIKAKNVLICDLAAARQEAEQKRAEAEKANHSKSQFLANMSHELRTPLNAILGFSEIIKSRILGDNIDRDVEYAGLIHHSGMHLLTLINDVLDLAKIEAGSFILVEEPLALDAAIAEAVTMMQHRAAEGGCVLRCAFEAGLPAVRADERAIKQVLLNLLSNALKFTLPGGTVTAFAHATADGGVAFGVADTGVGIARQDQAKVFEKFGQGRHAHVPKERGTGLGLAIVQGLIHAHGGQITLESVEHVGTTVTVALPAYRTITPELPLSAASRARPFAGRPPVTLPGAPAQAIS
jgi:two-component system cell cycle sensor histidine kinase PleC